MVIWNLILGIVLFLFCVLSIYVNIFSKISTTKGLVAYNIILIGSIIVLLWSYFASDRIKKGLLLSIFSTSCFLLV